MNPRVRRLAVPALMCVACAWPAAPAAAGCGGENHSPADPHRVGQPGHRKALVIGDSTMIYAGPRLAARGLEAYARGCRQFSAGLALVRRRKRAGRLPHLVVLALGANGGMTEAQIRDALHVVGRDRVLGLVTPRNHAGAAVAMRAFAFTHADRVLLVDWRARSAGHRGWFFSDGLHVNLAGADAYAKAIAGRAAGVIAPPVRHLRDVALTRPGHDCGRLSRAGVHMRVVILRARSPLSCARARSIAAQPPLEGFAHWSWYDWKPTDLGPWLDLYVCGRRRFVIATTAARGG